MNRFSHILSAIPRSGQAGCRFSALSQRQRITQYDASAANNYRHRLRRVFLPRNYFRMHQFEALGKMTGGRAEEYASIDAAALRKILESVKAVY
jgi:hypothetical protein